MQGTGSNVGYIMAEFEEHSSQFFDHCMCAMASSQSVDDPEPMDVKESEVSLLVLVVILI